jgi:hypothetical protein
MAYSPMDKALDTNKELSISALLGEATREMGANTEMNREIQKAILGQQLGIAAGRLPATESQKGIIFDVTGLKPQTREDISLAQSLAGGILRKQSALEVASATNKRAIERMGKDALDDYEKGQLQLFKESNDRLTALDGQRRMGQFSTQSQWDDYSNTQNEVALLKSNLMSIAETRKTRFTTQESGVIPFPKPAPVLPQAAPPSATMSAVPAPKALPMPLAPESTTEYGAGSATTSETLIEQFLKDLHSGGK